MFTVAILTVSDKGSRNEREDLSGEAIKQTLKPLGVTIVQHDIVPDEQEIIAQKLMEWADSGKASFIVTTGGTGLTPRDVTPEATLQVLEKLAPGFGEVMRAQTSKLVPTAMLSRAIAGTRKNSLIVNLPGSPKAVRECLEAILPALPHAIETVRGTAGECGTESA